MSLFSFFFPIVKQHIEYWDKYYLDKDYDEWSVDNKSEKKLATAVKKIRIRNMRHF